MPSFVDSGVTYDGAAANVISGYDHLIGQEVAILADGAVQPLQTVAPDGSITLANSKMALKVHAGLPITSYGETLPPVVPSRTSQPQPAEKATTAWVMADVLGTLGLEVGVPGGTLTKLNFRDASTPFNEPTPLFTGRKKRQVESGFSSEGRVAFQVTDPVPCFIRSLRHEVDPEEI